MAKYREEAKGHWGLVAAQLDEFQCTRTRWLAILFPERKYLETLPENALNIPLDPLDAPSDQFIIGGLA